MITIVLVTSDVRMHPSHQKVKGITFNCRFHMYDKKLKGVQSHDLCHLLCHKLSHLFLDPSPGVRRRAYFMDGYLARIRGGRPYQVKESVRAKAHN